MLRKRIIFTLVYSDGFFFQSRNFRIQKVGNLNWLEKNYKFDKISPWIDELIILNVSRDQKNIKNFSVDIKKIVKDVFIPISAGGGVKTSEDAKQLFENGADKVVLNTILKKHPDNVEKLVSKYGSQSVVASVDYKRLDGNLRVYINNGSELLDEHLDDYLGIVQDLGVGEIIVNSIDRDGTGFGFNLEEIDEIKAIVNVPLIVSGGAGNQYHLHECLKMNGVDAVSTANLFNFVGDGLPKARKYMIEKGANLANW